jgi:hypothetical protein
MDRTIIAGCNGAGARPWRLTTGRCHFHGDRRAEHADALLAGLVVTAR